MADTIPDINLTFNIYKNLYALSLITSGASVVIQNKSKSEMIIQVIAAQPNPESLDGVILQPREFLLVQAGENGLWAIGDGNLSIQEA